MIEVRADLATASDHVDRGDLWFKAVEAKYPLAVLSSTIAAYRWERRLEHGKVSLQLPQASRGIVPGSLVATSELKLAVYGPLASALDKATQLVVGDPASPSTWRCRSTTSSWR